jgi:aminoglycoside phosphotransferase (APT) family kinase protein
MEGKKPIRRYLMLSTENADLVRRDPGIPGLVVLMDPDALVDAIRPFIVVKGLVKATITYIRYKPATNCMIAYKLKIAGKTLLMHAKAHDADAVVKLKKALEKKNIAGPFGAGVVSLKDIGIVVSLFPNDRKLKTLRRLGEVEKLRDLLHRIFPDHPDFWDGTLHTLSYKPERRYVARLDVSGKPQAVLKFYTPKVFHKARINARVFKSRKHLNIPKKLGSFGSRWILGLNWLQGKMLSEILLADDMERAARMVKKTGKALAVLHSHKAIGLAYRSREAEMSALSAISKALEILCPALTEYSKNLEGQLVSWITTQPAINKPIHGDFYAKQALVHDGQISIVDLDEAVFGDPRADIGLFIAHMELDAVQGILHSDQVELFSYALLKGYQNRTGETKIDDINAYTAIGLFQLAHHPFRYCKPNWPKQTKEILNKVEKYINKSSIRKPEDSTLCTEYQKGMKTNLMVIDNFGAVNDPELPFLSQSLDPKVAERYLLRMLSPHGYENTNLDLHSIKVVRYKPGLRCIVEYEGVLVNHQKKNKIVNLLGKARTKGVDKITYNLCCKLWDSGFNAESTDGISIPQPVGIVPEMQMWFQRKVSGVPVINMLKKSRGIELSGLIAEAIHKLHKLNFRCRKQHTMDDELYILQDRLHQVSLQNPHWEKRLKRLMHTCDQIGSTVPSYKPTGIHRDFYFDNVLTDGSNLFLIDFDQYCKGDPGLDIGNFIGHLTEYSLRNLGNAEALIDQEKALEERFLQLTGSHLRTSVQVYTTLTLARHIYISTLFPDRRSYTESLLELCEQRLGIQQTAYKHTQLGQIL